jgi:hypothetical protein
MWNAGGPEGVDAGLASSARGTGPPPGFPGEFRPPAAEFFRLSAESLIILQPLKGQTIAALYAFKSSRTGRFGKYDFTEWRIKRGGVRGGVREDIFVIGDSERGTRRKERPRTRKNYRKTIYKNQMPWTARHRTGTESASISTALMAANSNSPRSLTRQAHERSPRTTALFGWPGS